MTKTTIIKVLILCGVVLFAFSCKENDDPCQIKRPKNLKSIDWENYNDVYTVYWTFYERECSEVGIYRDRMYHDTVINTFKVYGYLSQGWDWDLNNKKSFYLIDRSDGIFTFPYKDPHIQCEIIDNSDVVDLLKVKFATADVTKKCYVRGKLFIDANPVVCFDDCCGDCRLFTIFKIYSADDVYFE